MPFLFELLLMLLLLLSHLCLEGLPFLSILFQSGLLFLSLPHLLLHELLGHFGFGTAGVELLLAEHLESALLGLLVQLELH
jgi:hypothetical protein